jgi:hypothetical protein
LAQLRTIEEALYGFAQSQGRLPCPASDTSDGYEDGSAGACAEPHGFVPATSLGLSGQLNVDSLLLDPWGNPIRYSVATSLLSGGNPDFSKAVSTDSIDEFFNAGTLIAGDPTEDCNNTIVDLNNTGLFLVCDKIDDPAGNGIVLSDIAPAVVMSMGENWASSTSTNEDANAGSSMLGAYAIHDDDELVFISSSYIENDFDDQLVWLSPYVLFNRMVSAGKLP